MTCDEARLNPRGYEQKMPIHPSTPGMYPSMSKFGRVKVCFDLETSRSFYLLKIVYSSKSHRAGSITTKNPISKPGDSDNILWFLHGAVVWHCHAMVIGFPDSHSLTYFTIIILAFPITCICNFLSGPMKSYMQLDSVIFLKAMFPN